MNQPQKEPGSDQQQGANQSDGPPCAAPSQANPQAPLVNPLKAATPNVTTKDHNHQRPNEYRERAKKFCNWIWKITPGDVALVGVALIAVFIAIRQNTLINYQNTLMDTQNIIVSKQNDIITKQSKIEL